MSLLKVFETHRPTSETSLDSLRLEGSAGVTPARSRKPDDAIKTFMLIDQEADVSGEINSAGDVVIEGNFKGNITARNLTVRSTGRVTGKAYVENAHIDGDIGPELICSGLLSVQANGKLRGKIVYRDLTVEAGGKCLGEMMEYQTEQV